MKASTLKLLVVGTSYHTLLVRWAQMPAEERAALLDAAAAAAAQHGHVVAAPPHCHICCASFPTA